MCPFQDSIVFFFDNIIAYVFSLYDVSIHQSERSSLKVVCSDMTHTMFSTVSRSLLEKDRLIFALLLALEIEDSNGLCGIIC